MLRISREEELVEAFIRAFGKAPEVISQAPGRINIIGEHIDYNDGYVLPVAIDKYIIAAFAANGTSDLFQVKALDLNEFVRWNSTREMDDRPLWFSYIYGAIVQWQEAGLMKGGVDIIFTGNIPVGAGLSSSAALEAAGAIGLAKLWDIHIKQRDLALFCQKIEHQYVGVQCGIMDQYASVFGQLDKAILLDCLSVTHEYLPLHLNEHLFLLCNTGVTHSLASSGYNDRRASCDQSIEIIRKEKKEVKNWRDVTPGMLQALHANLDSKIYQRSLHVIGEIARVGQAAIALREGNLKELGLLMYQSHEDLSRRYEVSCVELDFLVDLAKQEPAILGARMMGGGFGGCTINLIRKNKVDEFVVEAKTAYKEQFGIELQTYVVESGEGAKVSVCH